MRVNDTVRTSAKLSRKDFIADKTSKARRRTSSPGIVCGILGNRDLLYLVRHDGETAPAVYLHDELEPEPNAYWRLTYRDSGFIGFVEVATYDDALRFQAELLDRRAKSIALEGPFYSDKELTEGLLAPLGLFDHLKEDA